MDICTGPKSIHETVPAPTLLAHVTPTSYTQPLLQPYGLMHHTGNVDVPSPNRV